MMAYQRRGLLDRSLNDEEETAFRQWAKDNWSPTAPCNVCWHPVVRETWEQLQEEWEKNR